MTIVRKTGYRGFTLVELMIALTLGAILATAMLQVVVGQLRIHRMTDDLSRVQENGRLAMDVLSRDLQLAGYQLPESRDISILQSDCGHSAPCARDGSDDRGDSLAVQYLATPTTQNDCTGAAVDRNTVIVNVYSVGDIDGDGIQSLYCRGYNATQQTYISTPTPLVDGIEALQVLYRIYRPEIEGYSYRSLDRLTNGDIANISAASIALLVGNGLPQGSTRPRDRYYQLLDASPLVYRNDRHIRRVFSTTIFFNNHRQGVTQ